jgi:phage host-nuclease inhibitor protein Gam
MSEWSDKWNAMPYDIRHIGSMCETEMRINQLMMEKARLKKRYLQSIKEVDEHIKNLKQFLKDAGLGVKDVR